MKVRYLLLVIKWLSLLNDPQFILNMRRFVAKKADVLFRPMEKIDKQKPDQMADEDSYAKMPALETFMGIDPHTARKHLYYSLQIKDIAVGVVTSIMDTGLVLQLLCLDEGKNRDIDDLRVTWRNTEDVPYTEPRGRIPSEGLYQSYSSSTQSTCINNKSYLCYESCNGYRRTSTACGFLWSRRCTRYYRYYYRCTSTCYKEECCTGYSGSTCTKIRTTARPRPVTTPKVPDKQTSPPTRTSPTVNTLPISDNQTSTSLATSSTITSPTVVDEMSGSETYNVGYVVGSAVMLFVATIAVATITYCVVKWRRRHAQQQTGRNGRDLGSNISQPLDPVNRTVPTSVEIDVARETMTYRVNYAGASDSNENERSSIPISYERSELDM